MKSVITYLFVLILPVYFLSFFCVPQLALADDVYDPTPGEETPEDPTPGEGAGTTNTLKNPLEGVAGTIPELIQKLLEIVVTIGIPIIVVMIIYTGFRFVEAQGNPDKLGKAKEALMWVLIGAGIILGAWVLANALAGTVDAIKSAANQS